MAMLCVRVTDYTDLAMSQVTQRQSVAYSGSIPHLMSYLYQLSADIGECKDPDRKGILVFEAVSVYFEPGMLVLEVCIGYYCYCYYYYYHLLLHSTRYCIREMH